MEVQVNAGERNWTLTAQNEFGKVELSDRADLTKRGISSQKNFGMDTVRVCVSCLILKCQCHVMSCPLSLPSLSYPTSMLFSCVPLSLSVSI